MDTHKARRIQEFASFCSGTWCSDEHDQNTFTSPETFNKELKERVEKRNLENHSSDNNDKYCLLSIPSFSLSKHLTTHNEKINDKEILQEIAISQLSTPFKMMIPLDVGRKPLIAFNSPSDNYDIMTPKTSKLKYDVIMTSFLNISRSLLLLIDSRLRSYALILIRHYDFNGSLKDRNNSTNLALLDWKVNELLKLCRDIRILDAAFNFEVNNFDETEATVYEDDEVVKVPLSFNVKMDIQLPGPVCSSQSMKVELSSCGSIYGSFSKHSNEADMHAISFVVDSKSLLKSLINQARNVARQAVCSISTFDINPASPIDATDVTRKVTNDPCRNGSEPNVRPILLKHAHQSSKRKKVSFSLETPDLSSENSLPKFSSMEHIVLPPPAIDPKLKDEDSEIVTMIDSVMELWDLTLSGKAPKRKKMSSPVAASFIPSF